MFALFLPVLIGMLGLGVDAAHLFNARRDIQGAADLAALAGASQLPDDSGSAVSIANNIAAENGFASGVTVTTPFDGDESQIEVSISEEVNLFFMPVLGLANVNVSARSVASHELNAGTAVLAKKDYHCWEGTFTLSANDIHIEGAVHSNGGMTITGDNNVITGDVTYKTGPPVYPHDGWLDCGPDVRDYGNNPAFEIESGPWQDWPVAYSRSDFPCTYSLGTNGNLERNGDWWVDGTMLPKKELMPGVICLSGNNELYMTEDGVTGNVTFVANRIDIAGRDLEFSAFHNGVLFFADSTSFPAMELDPVRGNWEGMIYNRNVYAGGVVEGGQIILDGRSGFHHTGLIVGWAVQLEGSNWSLFGTQEATFEPMRLVE